MHGFYNNGNTCYFNSAVQLLLRIHELSSHILKTDYTGDCDFTIKYKELIKVYFQNENFLKINIEPLLKSFQKIFPRFKSLYPHDAQDALFCVIDILEKSYPRLKSLVYGKRTQLTICPTSTKTMVEPFSFLILNGDKPTVGEMVTSSEKWHTLDDYEDDDGIKHNVATTKTYISEYPKVLFVSFDKKVNVNVNDFDNYELCASILHYGNQRGGHYVSMVKLKDWYQQDDDTITKMELPSTDSHHVLMYIAKNPPS